MQKGFAHLLLILLITLVIISAVGIYLSTFQKAKTPSPKPVSNPLPVSERSVMDSKSETKQSVYKNDLGFSFDIPEGFNIKEETEDDFHKRENGDMRRNFTGYVQYAPAEFVTSLYLLDEDNNYDQSPFSLWVFENPGSLEPAAFYNKYWYYPFIWGDFSSTKNEVAPKQEAVIGTLKGYSAKAKFRTGIPTFTYIKNGDYMYLFRTIDGDKNIDQKVLKSFVFPQVEKMNYNEASKAASN